MGMLLHPANGLLHIFDWRGISVLWCEPVVDREPGKASAGQGFEQGLHKGLLVTANKPAAVNDNGCRKGSGAIRNMSIKREADIACLGELDIGLKLSEGWRAEAKAEQ